MSQLQQLLKRLAVGKVVHVLVGGYAVQAAGSSLTTQDVDVACRMSPDNLLRLHEALADLHPAHRITVNKPPFTPEEAAKPGWKNLYLRTDWGQLDCLGEVAGIGDFEACLAQSEVLELGDFSLRILTLDALIQSKKVLDRPRDRHAVLELEVIRERLKKGATGGEKEPPGSPAAQD